MRRSMWLLLSVILLTFGMASCGETGPGTESEEKQVVYKNITAEQAKQIMDTETGYVILDVRTEEEYAAGHIPEAILIPDYEIAEKAESILVDKDQKILIYCRSGRRSKNAAEVLLVLGYTNLWEFGGIIDWNYEVETN